MPDSPGASDASVASSPAPPTRTHTKTFTTHMYHDDDDSRPGERDTKSSRKSKGGQRDANQSTIGKVKHLKKEDGDPLWRKDIQYDFLRAIFDDDNKVFLNSYEPERLGMQCFADLYIDTMARSSKTSKVLRDKLLSDREAAKGMAMAHQDTHAYKQLQDAPRLKSILKGAVEDRDEPRSILEIKAKNVPRTNPVNLIFLIVQSAQKIHELHFPLDQEFHDLVMKTNYSSITRAKAFLWLAWFYLESDFTEEGCDENPFGPGVDYGLNVANQGIPSLRALTTEEENEENIDTPEEIEFGEEKRQLRHRILEHDLSAIDTPGKRAPRNAVSKPIDDGPAILPHIRPNKQDSELDSPRSTPPPRLLPNRVAGGDRPSFSRRTGQLKHHKVIEAPSPGGSRGGDRERDVDTMPIRKSRPPTAHQLAVERNRNQRVEHILNRGLRKAHHRARKLRWQEGAIVRALRRMEYIDNALAPSDDEEGGPTAMFKQTGLGGLCPLKEEPDDFGEEFASYSASMRRINRRLERWSSARGRGISVVAPVKRIKNPADGNDMDADGNDPEENIGNDTAFDADVVMDETVADETVWE
ncbi:Ino eighty subunit 1 [Ceratocystis platani]|uniref:Ino eighty subunit 1 n=1 Tax=Ceratocystis fimbriata f. sp. platani TaxID=88771 RepID=A0A0F8B4P3_CERFI|nr:Ino eighty subunit 1 [Ceratocystis platani]